MEATSEAVAEARRIKRQRKLDHLEIPEEHLSITDELLGKGGFGEVYLADYNGHNAAAKVRDGFGVSKPCPPLNRCAGGGRPDHKKGREG